MTTAALGVTLTAVLGVLAGVVWGRRGILAAVILGAVATAIQVAAVHLLVGQRGASLKGYLARWGIGTALRFGGVVLFTTLVLIDRTLFPPLPAALGFVGVLIPLMALELRLVR